MADIISFPTDLQVRSDREVMDRNFFNKRFGAVANALNNVSARQSVYDAAEGTLVQLGLERLDETLGPLLTTLGEAAQLGFLVARAIGTSVSLTAGGFPGWVVTEGADLFTPTTYLLAQDDTDDTNWGIVKLVQWTKESANLATECVYATKTQASTQWTISCNSAAIPAFEELLGEAITAHDETLASAATVAGQMTELQAAVDAIQAGPVSSVAGKTGAITLVEGDIANLVADLASKASNASLTSQLLGKQNVSSLLNSLAGLVVANDQLIYATSTSSFAMAALTAFARSLLAAGNVGAAQTVLGISTFVKTLLDDADAAAVLTTLGMSPFFRSLIDDPDATTLRASMGALAAAAKATAAEVSTGTDDTKYITAAGLAGRLQQINAQGGSYTLNQANDLGKMILMQGGGTLTMPATFPAGWHCRAMQDSGTTFTYAPAAGATRQSPGTSTRTASQFATIDLFVKSNAGGNAAVWVVNGYNIT